MSSSFYGVTFGSFPHDDEILRDYHPFRHIDVLEMFVGRGKLGAQVGAVT